MKSNVTRGGGFRGALNYAFDVGQDATGDKNPELIGGTMSGTDPRALAAEFGHTRRLRTEISRPVWHCSLALPAGDRLDSQKWEDVAADFMREMKFPPDTQWVAIRHQDTDHDHVHLIASRISLSGQVWHGKFEAFKAIEATQVLEKRHELTVTAGLRGEKPEQARLKKGEVEMALATGSEPPRQALQRIVTAAAAGGPTVVQFVDRLAVAGVQVRPNIASTGRLSGMSFEYQGVAFKASQLGKAYSWPSLQKSGVTYEQDRDREALERLSAAVANHQPDQQLTGDIERDPAAVEPAVGADRGAEPEHGSDAPAAPGADHGADERGDRGAEPADRADPAAVEQPTAVPGERVEPADRAADEPARPGTAGADELRPGNGGAAADAGRADPTPAAAVESAADRDRQSNQPATGPSEADRPVTGGAEPANTTIEGSAGGAGGGTGNQQPAVEQLGAEGAPSVVETGSSSGSSGGRGRPAGNDWASRFRQASAAKRRAADGGLGQRDLEQGHARGARVAETDRQSARKLDPTAYLEASGYTVKREGRHLSVRAGSDEAYRVTRQQDGRWLWCDRYGNDGGDNIDLVREIEPGTGYAEAVYKLTGAPTVDMSNKSNVDRNNNANVDRQPPRLPIMSPTDREPGRLYLRDRGISADTIAAAEACGMVRYTRGAVLFVGTDASGAVQNVTRRAIAPDDPVQKRDLRGSDKQYPPVLPGNPADVWVVEGGADALAVHDLYRRADAPVPTVIVSSGANVLSWAGNHEVQPMLIGARVVVVAEEHEKDEEARERADTGHRRQREALEALGCKVASWKPPEGYKDLADYNERRGDIEQRREQERAQRAAIRQERGKSRDSGPKLG